MFMIMYPEEPEIDFRDLADTITSLNKHDFSELVKFVYECIGGDVNEYGKDTPSPDKISVLALLGAVAGNRDKEALERLMLSDLVKSWGERLGEMEEKEMWHESIAEDNKFYKSFLHYISDDAVGDKGAIVSAIAELDHVSDEGYVKVRKRISDNQEVYMTFTASDGCKHTAKWQHDDNYAVCQTCGMAGDDYSGWMLFPTHKDDTYFAVYYNC